MVKKWQLTTFLGLSMMCLVMPSMVWDSEPLVKKTLSNPMQGCIHPKRCQPQHQKLGGRILGLIMAHLENLTAQPALLWQNMQNKKLAYYQRGHGKRDLLSDRANFYCSHWVDCNMVNSRQKNRISQVGLHFWIIRATILVLCFIRSKPMGRIHAMLFLYRGMV